jgi:hypothetical protein
VGGCPIPFPPRAPRPRLHFNHYVSPLNLERIHLNFCAWVLRCLASLRIPLPPVPGTDYFVSLNQTLAQGSAAMKAYVVHGRDCPIHIGHADDFLAERKFSGFACWRKFRFICEFYETCHGTFQKMEVRTAELRSARTAGGGCPHVVSAAALNLAES